MIPASLVGALVGLAIALPYVWFLRKLSGRVDLPETKRVLKITGIVQLVLIPVAGWFIAPLMVGE